MNRCRGCGAILQMDDSTKEGYTKNINYEFCERCFRIQHYSEYKKVDKDNKEFMTILKNIGLSKSLVVLVVDLFNIPKEIEILNQYITNPILLVLTKRDLLPLSIYDNNLFAYFKNYNLNIVDEVIISSSKNYHFDLLLSKIRKYQTSKEVYIVGFTNAGKSTMINKLFSNYTAKKATITTSMLPSTTIDTIKMTFDEELILIDTPGLLDKGNIINYIDYDMMKKVVPSKEIKPRTYQIKVPQTIIVDSILRLDALPDNSLTLYISNSLDVERIYKPTDKLINLVKHDLFVADDNDIVITGLGFIKVVKSSKITIYTLDNVDVYVRKSLI